MATSTSALTITGGSHLKSSELWTPKPDMLARSSRLTFQKKPRQIGANRNLSIRADYNDGTRSDGGGGDFVTGFLLGGAVFGTLAYIFAPQIRKSILNEDDHGFRRSRRPIYYDEGLETRETLNAKISQLNSAIDNVSQRLRGGKKAPKAPVESDSEIEAAM